MLKKLIVNTLFVAVLVTALDFIIGHGLRHYYFTAQSGDEFRTTYAIDTTKAELLVFGSSRAKFHYVPSILQQRMHLSVYNVGRNAQGILFDTAVFKAISRRYSPQVVILEFDGDLEQREGEYGRLASLLPYYRDHPELRQIVQLRGPLEKVKHLSQIYPFNSMLVSIIGGNLALNKTRSADDRGYMEAKGEWNEPLMVVKEQPAAPIDPNKVAAFRDFLATARKSQAIVIVVNSPAYRRESDVGRRNLARDICQEFGVEYLDFANNAEYLDHRAWFKDVNHLNKIGAAHFTEQIAAHFAQHHHIKITAAL